jgi:hypothetical protein
MAGRRAPLVPESWDGRSQRRGRRAPVGTCRCRKRCSGPATVGHFAASIRLVVQIDEEPLVAALRAGAEAMVAGRRRDPAVFAVAPLPRRDPRGQALDMGEVPDLAAMASLP